MFDWLGLTTLLALGYALFIGVCAAHIAGRLRRPPRRTYAWAVSKGLPGDPGELRPPLAFEERTVEWRGVSIAVWDVRGVNAGRGDGERKGEGESKREGVGDGDGEGEGLVVVLTPGWGDSRVGGLVRLSALAPLCSRIILWDPPGLGATELAASRALESQAPATTDQSRDREGAVSSQTAAHRQEPPGRRPRQQRARRTPKWSMSARDHEALAAVLDELCRGGSPPRGATPVVLFGWSAGAGASIVAAARNESTERRPWRIAGVIAEAPYRLPWTPARNVIRAGGLPWFLCGPLAFGALGLRLGVGPRWRGFDRASHAAALKGRVPLLVLHGADDEVCPVSDGREIASAGGGEIVEIPRGRHNDLWVEESHRGVSVAAVRAFLEKRTAESGRRAEEPHMR